MNTFRNKNAMYYGNTDTLKSDESNVFKFFSQNGYVTGNFLDLWWNIEGFWDTNLGKMKQFYNFDHDATTINWDFNYSGLDHEQGIGEGPNAHYDRWLYGKTTLEIQLEYLSNFWMKYPDVPKYFQLFSNYAHESTGELIKYADEPLEKFLNDFKSKGYMKDTEVLILSDHGAHFLTSHTPVFPDDSRYEENMLPMLFYITYKDSEKEKLHFLRENQQQFFNSLDYYGTLKAIAIGKPTTNDTHRYYAVQYEMLPKGRDCTDGDGITYFECWCRNDVSKLEELRNKHGYFYIQF